MSAQNPIVTNDGASYTITLFRNQKPKKFSFGTDYVLYVHVAPEADVDPWIRSKIIGAPEDGLLYYIKGELHKNGVHLPHVGVDFYQWLNGKEEALSVLKAIHQAQDEIHDCGSCATKF